MSAEFVREATHDWQRIAMLRCYDDADGTVVEAEVFPNGSSEAVPRGPYRFANAHEAYRFVQETMLALQYLGCSVL